MDIGLYSGVSAMRANEKRMDAIAMNLANLDTPAYKRQASFTQSLDVAASEYTQREISTQYAIDFTQGDLVRTGQPLDLALEGEGFFAVESPRGEVYTRNGKLRLDEKGVLQTVDGYPVVWEGARGRISPVGDAITVDGSGMVRQGSAPIGKLAIRDFAAKRRLEVDDLGYFHAPLRMPRTVAPARVEQGSVERSNASSIDELVAMIKVQRSFETAASVMHTIDQSYRRLNAQR